MLEVVNFFRGVFVYLYLKYITMYTYKVEILQIIDGDTLDAKVDLGFKIFLKMRFRLTGINAPEMKTPEGFKSRARLLQLLPIGSLNVVQSNKDKQEKFGRYLGIFYDTEDHNVNDRMVLEGFAVPYMTPKG